MSQPVQLRESTPDDLMAIESLYPEAFPDEDLLPLVRDLLREPALALSLVALSETQLLGHALFTHCVIERMNSKASLIGPLAVRPIRQRQGIGTRLVVAGLQHLEDAGVSQVFVLGDPAYYSRLGFSPDSFVTPPYALPPEWAGAWQSKLLGSAPSHLQGKLEVPKPWLRPALWSA